MNQLLTRLSIWALILISIVYSNRSLATHIPGANITYECDPNDPLTYTFTLTLFRVCPGTHPITMGSTYFSMTNTCGLTNPVMPTFNQVGVAEDVNQLCSSATSDCSGGTSPGLWKYTYEATITLPADCDSWTISYNLCCRDQSSNLANGTSNDMNVSTTMNTLTAPCDNSPVVTSVPMPYACANTTFNYCLTTMDPEGDSTTFTMVTPSSTGGAPIPYLAGFSVTQPLNNFTLDPLTGCISFNHPTTGNFVVAIRIDSFDDNGNLISSIIHDFQVIVMSCTNTPPANPVGGMQNFSGTGTQLGPNTIGACYGDAVCFDVVFEDLVDVGDNITIQQDGTGAMPGATFVQTGTNPATGTFCWTVQPGYTSNVVTFIAEDDGCPVMGTSGFGVNFNIATGVFAGPDPNICGSQTAQLQANGANNYTWTPGTGLSCTNCPNPVASPAITTTYTLTGDLVGTCPNVDQITVNVVPDFTPTMNPISTTICANEIAQLDVSGPGALGPYTYDWSPISTLNDPAISNPLAQPLASTTYTVTMTSLDGCVKTETTDVIVSGIGPTVTIVPSDTTICPGESIPYSLNAQVLPVMCGLSAGCTGTSSYVELGTATTASSTYSPFYGSSSTTIDYTKKIQYIYTAAELNALGYNGGTIRDIALYTTTIASYLHDDVTIWIGCTSLDEFSSTAFEPVGNLTQVYGPTNNINPINGGWTSFDINDWDWDGTSNLIIQFCTTEDNVEGNNGIESVRYSTTTPAYRCNYDFSSTVASCSEATGSRLTSRANMRFNICVADVVSPTYTWSPGATLSATNISNPTASPTSAISYVVDVTANGCTGSGIAQVNIDNSNSVVASNDVSWCVGDPPINLDAQFMINGVPTSAATGANCYDQTISYANPALLTGTNNFSFTGTPAVSTGGTLTINAYGDLDGAVAGTNEEMWTVYDENSNLLGTAGGSNTQCGFLHTVVIPLSAAQLNAWLANGSVDFSGVDVAGNVSATLCGVGQDLLELRLEIDCPAGSGYIWSPAATLDDPNLQSPTATPSVTTTYYVTTTAGTCSALDSVIVTWCDPLPIELISFSGYNSGELNELFWQTATEMNNDYFILQRSVDGMNFNDLMEVDAVGNSMTMEEYRTLDMDPITGVNYYRLKQVDTDGSYGYSETIVVNTERVGYFHIYPNPTTNDLFIDISTEVEDGQHTIIISDIAGKIIREQMEFSHLQKTYKVNNFAALSRGMYLVKILDMNDEVLSVERISKQ